MGWLMALLINLSSSFNSSELDLEELIEMVLLPWLLLLDDVVWLVYQPPPYMSKVLILEAVDKELQEDLLMPA